MGVHVIFEAHATSVDNDAELASGWYDAPLSPLGELQAKELGERRRGDGITAIWCSDLARSYRTAEVAFGRTCPIVRDPRLREIHYGDLTRAPVADIQARKRQAVDVPFPNGESYRTAVARVEECLQELLPQLGRGTVLVIGHRATQYGLERMAKGVDVVAAVEAPWQWQPGWSYILDGLGRRADH